jgi:hypothetical protein
LKPIFAAELVLNSKIEAEKLTIDTCSASLAAVYIADNVVWIVSQSKKEQLFRKRLNRRFRGRCNSLEVMCKPVPVKGANGELPQR